VHVVLATEALAAVGGSETYLHTVAGNLVRLGHQVTAHATRQGLMSDQFRDLGVDVVFEDGLPDTCDAVLVQDSAMAYALAERWPDRPQVFVNHSALFDLQLPPVIPVAGSVVVTLSDRNGDRIRAMPGEHEIVRLRQPIDSVRLAPRGAPAPRPRKALLLGNYLQGDALATIVDAWSPAKVDLVQVGNLTQPTLDVAEAIADADIVVGKGRAVLEAMSCGRPAFLYDAFGADGWVTASTYDAFEADAFAGQSSPRVLGPDDLRDALDQYDPTMGHVNRELVLKHHQDRKHAEALVGIFKGLSPGDPAATPSAELARLSRLRWRAEQEAGALRRQLDTVTVRLQESEAKRVLSEKRRRQRARAAAQAEARLAELGVPAPGSGE
jgi:hypothetical protein